MVNGLAKNQMSRLIKVATILWCTILLASLKSNLLTIFFASTNPNESLGVDFWSIPRGFLNLLNGKSMYDTFGGVQYGGGFVTWYLSHPLFELTVAPFFSFTRPIVSFYLWTITNIFILLFMGHLFARRVHSANLKSLCYLLSVFGFPVLSLLYTGNVHTYTVLAFAFILLGFHLLARMNTSGKNYFILGTFLSLFTKPIVLLMLPMFLLLPETRKPTFWIIMVYAFVSIIMVSVPAINPQTIGWQRILELFQDPQYVKEHLNIYANKFVINAEMKDNAIHWLNLIAQSDYSWNHIQIFSLSTFLNALFITTFNPLYFKIPLALALATSLFVAFIPSRVLRLEAALWVTALLCLSFFLSYNTVWEYQFTLLIPISLICIILIYERGVSLFNSALLLCCFIVALPSLYFLVGPDIQVEQFALVRSTRVIPVLVMYGLIFCRVMGLFLHSIRLKLANLQV